MPSCEKISGPVDVQSWISMVDDVRGYLNNEGELVQKSGYMPFANVELDDGKVIAVGWMRQRDEVGWVVFRIGDEEMTPDEAFDGFYYELWVDPYNELSSLEHRNSITKETAPVDLDDLSLFYGWAVSLVTK